MAHLQKIIPHYTYEDYLHWEGRWELIDGHPIAMSPAPTPRHQQISAQLIAEFHQAIKKAKCKKCNVYDPIDYKIAEDTILQPDVLIICEKINKRYLDFAPSLVVEILSPSTAMRDRHTKYEIYQQQGIKYYLIVDLDKDIIEIYSNSNSNYILQNTNSENEYEFSLDEECKIKIDFKELSWD